MLAGYAHTHSAEVDAYINGQYFADIYTPTNTDSGMRAWSVSGGIEWNPLANDDNDDFQVTLEGKYVNVDTNGYFSAFGTLRSDIWEVAMQVLHEF